MMGREAIIGMIDGPGAPPPPPLCLSQGVVYILCIPISLSLSLALFIILFLENMPALSHSYMPLITRFVFLRSRAMCITDDL